MKQIYIAANLPDAHMFKDYLQAAGIDCLVKGELLAGAVGEIPANSYPTVWILDPEDEARALELVKNYESAHPSDQIHLTYWQCPACAEDIEPQFTQCWNCGYQRENQ